MTDERPAPDDDPELDPQVPTDAVPTHPDDPKPMTDEQLEGDTQTITIDQPTIIVPQQDEEN